MTHKSIESKRYVSTRLAFTVQFVRAARFTYHYASKTPQPPESMPPTVRGGQETRAFACLAIDTCYTMSTVTYYLLLKGKISHLPEM